MDEASGGFGGGKGTSPTLRIKREELSLTIGIECYGPDPKAWTTAASTGAPKGNRNALKHGYCTSEAIARRRAISLLIRCSRNLSG